jgi:hypothetical protein
MKIILYIFLVFNCFIYVAQGDDFFTVEQQNKDTAVREEAEKNQLETQLKQQQDNLKKAAEQSQQAVQNQLEAQQRQQDNISKAANQSQQAEQTQLEAVLKQQQDKLMKAAEQSKLEIARERAIQAQQQENAAKVAEQVQLEIARERAIQAQQQENATKVAEQVQLEIAREQAIKVQKQDNIRNVAEQSQQAEQVQLEISEEQATPVQQQENIEKASKQPKEAEQNQNPGHNAFYAAMLVFLIICAIWFRLKAIQEGIIIDFEKNTFNFPGGGISPNDTSDFFTLNYLLQFFKRFIVTFSEIREIKSEDKTTRVWSENSKKYIETRRYYIYKW